MQHSGGADLGPVPTVSHELLNSKHKSSSHAGTTRTVAPGVERPRSEPAQYDQPQTCLRHRTRISSPTSRILLSAEGAIYLTQGEHDDVGDLCVCLRAGVPPSRACTRRLVVGSAPATGRLPATAGNLTQIDTPSADSEHAPCLVLAGSWLAVRLKRHPGGELELAPGRRKQLSVTRRLRLLVCRSSSHLPRSRETAPPGGRQPRDRGRPDDRSWCEGAAVAALIATRRMPVLTRKEGAQTGGRWSCKSPDPRLVPHGRDVAIGIVSSATAGRAKHSSAPGPTRAC